MHKLQEPAGFQETNLFCGSAESILLWKYFLSVLLFVFRCKDFNTYTENLSYPEKQSVNLSATCRYGAFKKSTQGSSLHHRTCRDGVGLLLESQG